MIHQYQNNGYNIVMDVNSGGIHVVDPLAYDVIAWIDANVEEPSEASFTDELSKQITDEFAKRASKEELTELLGQVACLVKDGMLFSKDPYEGFIDQVKARKTVVKAMCLHIAHDCNLACRYCFAEEGEYHGRRALMSYEVGKKALDFLIASSGNRKNLEVDFFGGEPLMNWDTVKQLVAYGREQEKLHDKHFRFTLTTNGVLLNDEVQEFLKREMDNVVMSLHGR